MIAKFCTRQKQLCICEIWINTENATAVVDRLYFEENPLHVICKFI